MQQTGEHMTEKPEAGAPRIATVIVNYRAADLIVSHIGSLVAEYAAFPGSKIYIVDNASPGDDAQQLAALAAREDMKDLIRFIPSAENGGFAKGNNLALREILEEDRPADFILLLNPDAYLHPGALGALAAFMQSRRDAGFVGARLESESGEAHVSAFRFFSIASEFEGAANIGVFSALLKKKRVAPPQKDRTGDADWLCGAALLIRREVFEAVGLFDENYFLYYEETDLMLQGRRAGWPAWYLPDARAVHYMGRSTGVKNGLSEERDTPHYWYESRAYYFRKNHGALYAFLADLAWFAGAGLHLLRVGVFGGKRREAWRKISRFWKIRFSGESGRMSSKASG